MNTSSKRFDIPTRPRINVVCVVAYLAIPALMWCLLVWVVASFFQ